MKTTSLSVRAERLDSIKARVEHFNGKAELKGLPKLTLTVIRRYMREKKAVVGNGTTITVPNEFVEIELQAPEALRIKGWKMVAILEPIVDKNNNKGTIVVPVPGVTPPSDLNKRAASVCEHCDTQRLRARAYVLQHDDGTLKQVGSACLDDFLGHSAAEIVLYQDLLHDVEAWAEREAAAENDIGFGGGQGAYVRLRQLLIITSAILRVDGWVWRRTLDETMPGTSRYALMELDGRRRGGATMFKECEDDFVIADAAIDWARATLAPQDDFSSNLKLLGGCDHVAREHAGIAAYLVAAYMKSLTPVGLTYVDEHFGEIKKRSNYVAVVDGPPRISHGAYGESFIYSFNVDGKRATWFASKPQEDLKPGAKVKITATVKAHDVYKGNKQTTLTRVTVDGPA